MNIRFRYFIFYLFHFLLWDTLCLQILLHWLIAHHCVLTAKLRERENQILQSEGRTFQKQGSKDLKRKIARLLDCLWSTINLEQLLQEHKVMRLGTHHRVPMDWSTYTTPLKYVKEESDMVRFLCLRKLINTCHSNMSPKRKYPVFQSWKFYPPKYLQQEFIRVLQQRILLAGNCSKSLPRAKPYVNQKDSFWKSKLETRLDPLVPSPLDLFLKTFSIFKSNSHTPL